MIWTFACVILICGMKYVQIKFHGDYTWFFTNAMNVKYILSYLCGWGCSGGLAGCDWVGWTSATASITWPAMCEPGIINGICVINQSNKSLNALVPYPTIPGPQHTIHDRNVPVPYPTILNLELKYAYFCYEWCIVGYGAGALWDLWEWPCISIIAWGSCDVILCRLLRIDYKKSGWLFLLLLLPCVQITGHIRRSTTIIIMQSLLECI